jgi:transposase-like protein
MGLLRRIAGKDKQQEPSSTGQGESHERIPCPHTALTPRWNSVEDMGKEDRVTSYLCQACGSTFTPEEARPYLI